MTRRRDRLFVTSAFCILLLLLPLGAGASHPAVSPPRHVLLLHSYHKGMKWVDDITDSFTSTLTKQHSAVEFHVEYMDTKRVVGLRHLQDLFTEYRHKFQKQKFDLVVTADDTALRFALQHYPELFPGSPLVFCGVNNFEPHMLDGRPEATGVLEDVDVTATVATALDLYPAAKRVYVINDRSETGIGLHKRITDGIAPLLSRASFTFLEDYSVPELAEIVSRLPDDSIVLRSAFFIDRDGRPLADERVSYGAIDSHAKVPVYSLWDFYLGLGIVGGKLVSGASQGEHAALIGARILNGEAPASIPIETLSPNRFVFDYRQLQHFGIDRANLPPDSTLINMPEPFYVIHKGVTWGGVTFAVVMTFFAVVLSLNINKRRQTEETLRQAEAKFRELFNGAGDAILIHDMNSRLLEANQSACDRYGYSRNEFLAMTVGDIDAPEQAEFIPERMETLRTQGRVVFETEHVRKNGSRLMVEVNARIIHYERREAVLSIVRDITERKEVERLKDEMISAVSHEMHTPLTAMLGYTEFMLQNEVEPPQQKIYLKTIHAETQRLSNLIGMFLDLQRFKSRWGSLNCHQVPVHPLMEETYNLYRTVSPSHPVALECPLDLPPLWGDGKQLHQVLNNLVSNAVKYSPEGGQVALGAFLQGAHVTMWVRDAGIGIPVEEQQNIFEKFYRINNSARRTVGGTGLGLALVREIIAAHGGKVWVESTVRKGSTFFVSVPTVRKGTSGYPPQAGLPDEG